MPKATNVYTICHIFEWAPKNRHYRQTLKKTFKYKTESLW